MTLLLEPVYVSIVSLICIFFYRSIICHNLSLSFGTVLTEIHLTFTLKEMWNVAGKLSIWGVFELLFNILCVYVT